MGIRLNILDNPALRMQVTPIELTQGGNTANVNQPAQPAPAAEATTQAAPAQAPPGNAATFPLDGRMDMPQAPLMANLIDQGNPAAENNAPPSVIEANAEANRAQQGLDGAPAPRIHDFRFFVAAESVQERQLETRIDLLEQRLETANNRLQYSDSLPLRIDAQLDRARLEQDLDMVSSKIRRMRLERAFARPPVEVDTARQMAATEPVAQPVGNATEAQAPETTRFPGLNLLA